MLLFSVVTVELESRSYIVEETTVSGVAELVVLKNGINDVNVTVDVNIFSGSAQGNCTYCLSCYYV